MKKRTLLLAAGLLALMGCTAQQRHSMVSSAAASLLDSLLRIQSTAPLTQSTFKESQVPEARVDDRDLDPPQADGITPEPGEPRAAVETISAPLPLASNVLPDVAARATGVALAKRCLVRKMPVPVRVQLAKVIRVVPVVRCRELASLDSVERPAANLDREPSAHREVVIREDASRSVIEIREEL